MVAGHLQEKKGYFYMVLSYPDAAGKRKTKWFPTGLPVKGNKKKAEKMFCVWKISESVIFLSLKYGMITLFAIPEYDAYVVSAIVGFAISNH